MAAKVLKNEFYPESSITLALFKNVENTKQLRQCVMGGEFEASLLKTSMILDVFQVIVAANRAVHLNKVNKMTTKNVHSEILFSLSPTKNISDSFRKFGVDDNDKSVMVVIAEDMESKVLNVLTQKVQGQLADLSELSQFTDVNNVKKIYKITETELTSCSLLEAVVSRIASQDVVVV